MRTLAKRFITSHPLVAFFALTFALAWSIWIPVGLLAPDLLLVAALPGAWAPTLSAVFVTAVTEGRPGLRAIAAGLKRWRIGALWYVVVLFGVAFIALAATGLNAVLGGDVSPPSLPAGVPGAWWPVALPIIFLVNVFVGGPLAEDVGWRGFAVPRLLRDTTGLNAGLIVGGLWALWHAPFYFVPGAASVTGGVPFVWFAPLTVAWSVLFAWVYVNTQSILLPVLFHAAINTALGSLGLLGQKSGDLTAMMINVALTWIVVVAIVAVCGPGLRVRLSRV